MSSSDSQGIDLSEVFAPIYWGFVVSLFLGGITIVQGYIYFSAESRDRSLVRSTACLMLFLDIASSGLVAQSVYYYLIPHFGSLLPLSAVTPELSAECLISTMITFISQLYFVYQLYIVKRLGNWGRWVVLGSISASAILAFAGGVACVSSMYVFKHGVLSNRSNMFAVFFGVAKGFGAITDILATIAMCIYLTSSRTGIAQTNSLLNYIMGFVIHRGVLVTLIQTLLLITFYAVPGRLYWFAFHVLVTKLYANTFFAMLNGRNHYKERRQNHNSALTPSFTATTTHQSRKYGMRSDQYDLRALDLQNDMKAMPTVSVTKTIEISDL